MMHNETGNNNNNVSMATAANSVEQIYDVILGVGFIVLSILALADLLMMTINKFVKYYSRQIDRIVMEESESECSDDDEDDDSSESGEYSESEYSESEYSESEYSEYSDDDEGDCSYHNSYKNKKKQTLHISPRRSERLLNRAKCNSPLLIRRLKFD
jgi:hypothetical protein